MKKIATKVHHILGLASGLIVLIVSLTGALYVFEQEWRELTQAKYLYVARQDLPMVSLDTVQAIMAIQYPKDKITSIRLQNTHKSDKSDAIIATTKNKIAVSFNPHTAHIIGVRDMNTDFMSVVVQIHTNLLLGDVGVEIIKWNVLIFFIVLISGIIVWLPPNIQMLKWVLKFGKAKTKYQFNYDLHRIVGFYASFILLIVALTGIWWVFEGVQHTVYDLTNSDKTLLQKVKQPKAPPQYQGIFSVENAFDIAQNDPKNSGWTQAFIQPARDTATPMSVLMRFPYSLVRKQNRLTFDQFTGKILRADYYQNYSFADKIRVSNFDWHTGRIGGIFTKILYFVAALFAASLPITGFLIWFNKSEKRRRTVPFMDLLKKRRLIIAK